MFAVYTYTHVCMCEKNTEKCILIWNLNEKKNQKKHNIMIFICITRMVCVCFITMFDVFMSQNSREKKNAIFEYVGKPVFTIMGWLKEIEMNNFHVFSIE